MMRRNDESTKETLDELLAARIQLILSSFSFDHEQNKLELRPDPTTHFSDLART